MRKKGFEQLAARFGQGAYQRLEFLGGLSMMMIHTFKALPKMHREFKSIVEQFLMIGAKSLPLVFVITLFTGMVLSLQFIEGLSRFGLEIYTGNILGVSLTRELGPVLTALMVTARAGAGMTAELGSMSVTEQILAVEAMGADPIVKLVMPRVIAASICTPLLTAVGDLVGVMGGMMISTVETGMSSHFFIDQLTQSTELYDFGSGVGKSFFFGFFIGVIACYRGINTYGGGVGVGRSTTRSVVASSITIFVSDFFLTKLFLLF